MSASKVRLPRPFWCLLLVVIAAQGVSGYFQQAWMALVSLNLGFLGMAVLLQRDSNRLRQKSAEILAAHQIIDNLVHEHWLLLSEVNRALLASLDSQEMSSAVIRIVVPGLAEYCRIVLPGGGKGNTDLSISSDPTRDSRFTQMIREALESGITQVTHDQNGCVTGIVIPMKVRAEPSGVIIFEQTSSKRGFGKFDSNLAQQIALHMAFAEENATLYRQACEAARAREEMLEMVSHDIKSPLTAVDLQASLLQRMLMSNGSEASPRQLASLEQIQGSVRCIYKLIEDLLDVTTIGAGRLVVTPTLIPLSPLLNQLMEMMRPIASRKSVDLRLELNDTNLSVFVESTRLLQVLMNLVGNAIKFTPDGGIVIISVEQRENDEIRLSIADTGIGIDPKDVKHIFERYWQGSHKRPRSSAGLGLAICKGIVEAHGGSISVESTPGVGSKFTVALPARGMTISHKPTSVRVPK